MQENGFLQNEVYGKRLFYQGSTFIHLYISDYHGYWNTVYQCQSKQELQKQENITETINHI